MFFLLTLVSIIFSGCSSEENNNDSDNLFLKINVSGTEYNSDGLFGTGFSGEENCLNNGDLFLQYVGQIETSNFFIECDFVHFENGIDFENTQKNNVNITRITDINDLYEMNFSEDVCSRNNDFSLVFPFVLFICLLCVVFAMFVNVLVRVCVCVLFVCVLCWCVFVCVCVFTCVFCVFDCSFV